MKATLGVAKVSQCFTYPACIWSKRLYQQCKENYPSVFELCSLDPPEIDLSVLDLLEWMKAGKIPISGTAFTVCGLQEVPLLCLSCQWRRGRGAHRVVGGCTGHDLVLWFYLVIVYFTPFCPFSLLLFAILLKNPILWHPDFISRESWTTRWWSELEQHFAFTSASL